MSFTVRTDGDPTVLIPGAIQGGAITANYLRQTSTRRRAPDEPSRVAVSRVVALNAAAQP
jgi:hypothetical protein